MVKYNREILSIYVDPKREDLLNVVSRVTWRWTAREELSFADLYIDTVFSTIDPNNFIDYVDLTDEIVFGWIDSVEDLNKLKQDLDLRLEEAKKPSMVEKTIPWSLDIKYTGHEEYLLVLDDSPDIPNKVLGPIRWDSNRANLFLKQNALEDYEFPPNITMYQKEILPLDFSVTINDRVKIYKAEYIPSPALDSTFQFNAGPSWSLVEGRVIVNYNILDRPIDDIKTTLISKLIGISFEKQTSDIDIIHNDEILKINISSDYKINYIQRWLTMSEFDVITEKVNIGKWITLTKQELKNILDVIANKTNETLLWEKTIYDQIMSSSTVEELKSIRDLK